MEILAKNLLDDYTRKHADSVTPVGNWVKMVRLAKWKTPQDVRNAINSVDFLPGNVVIFNIGGNNHRLAVKAIFVVDQVRILWIGTHAQYSKKNFKAKGEMP